MQIDVRVPQLSESVSEATLLTWHKQVGEAVSEGENLIDIETDKVVLELPASKSGVLTKIIKGDGEKVTSNELIAQIDTEAAAKTTAPPPAVPSAVPPSVRKLAREHDLTPTQLALAFMRSRWCVASTIVGASSVTQLAEDLDACAVKLDEEVLVAIDRLHLLHGSVAP